MKVICIQEPTITYNGHTGRQVDIIPLVVGQYYTVINVETHSNKNTYYDLEEIQYPFMTVWHNSKMFAQISDIDETEMERDWMLVKIKANDPQRT